MTADHEPPEKHDPSSALVRNVVALFSGVLLWTMCHFGILAVLPLFLHDQGWDARAIGFALGASGVAQVCVRPFAGWLIDAFGRRLPLVMALLLLAVATGLLLVPAGGAVLANRVLTGIAFSIGTTAFYTLTVEVAPAARRSEVQGYIALGMTLGIGFGPPIAVAVYQGLARGTTAPERLATLAVATAVVALLSGACFRATRSAFRPLGRTHPLRMPFHPSGIVPGFLNFCIQVPYTGFSGFLPLWALGRGVANPGLLFVSSQVGNVVSRLFGGRLADRHGYAAIIAPAMIGSAAALAATGIATGLPAFLVLAAAYGLCYGVSVVVALTVAAEAAPPEERSAVINTYGLGSDVAQLLGPWGLGLAAGMWGLDGALVVAGAVPFAGAVVFLAARRGSRPTHPAAPSPHPARSTSTPHESPRRLAPAPTASLTERPARPRGRRLSE
jgi:MFS family permease